MFFNRGGNGDILKKAVVKVGHSSSIALRSIKVYRAITFKELENHIANKDISLIVIESIPPKEIPQAEKVIQTALRLNKPIYIHNNDPSIIELEIGSKYNIEIISSLSDLQKHISDKIGVDVTTSTEQTATEKEHTEENIEQTETEEEQEQAEEEETEPIETYIQHIEESIQQEEESTEPTETEKQQTEENIEHTTELKQQTEIEKEQTAELKQQIVSLKGEITALTSSKEFIENELELVKSDKDTLEDKIYQLNLEIDSLNGELEVIHSNDSNINTLHNSIKSLEEEIELEYKSNKLTHSLLVSSLDSLTDLDRKLSDSLNAKNELECIQGDLERLVNSSKEKITELEGDIKRVEDRYTLEKSEIQAECDKEIEQMRNQMILERKELEQRYQDELSRLKEEHIKSISITNNIQDTEELTNKVTNLNKEIHSLKGHINKLNIDIANKDRVYKDTLVELDRYRGQHHDSIEFNCVYTGTAKVIPVFGSGSYGVTTTAVSIARKLPKAKVLYMDMDLANPKADGWFKAQPILDSSSLSDIPNNINKTSLGILIDYGAKFVVDNKSSIIQRVSETKNNVTIDYFGGLYGKLDTHRLKLVDFTYLLNTLGSMYDYIIVDCGKYGLYDTSNELIDMFMSIAYKSIVVTPNDRLDTRNMSLKLSQNNIDISKIIWVLNLSESTTVTPVVKKNIMGAIPVIMPLTPSAYGKQTSFDKIPILKDKLLEIISKIQ